MHRHFPPELDAIKTAFCLKTQCQAGVSGAGGTALRGNVRSAAARPATAGSSPTSLALSGFSGNFQSLKIISWKGLLPAPGSRLGNDG